jgi:Flp pilus assembly protein TadB
MINAISLIFNDIYFSILALIINLVIANEAIRAMNSKYRDAVNAAFGGNDRIKLYAKNLFANGISAIYRCCGNNVLGKTLDKSTKQMEKSGYTNPYAGILLIILRYILPLIIFIFVWIINFPQIIRPIIAALCVWIPTEIIIRSKRKKFRSAFQKNAYKIYKYLHNQVSSGIKVADAVKSVYEIIDDKGLRKQLLRLSAEYDLTLDMEKCLEEFEAKMDSEDASSFCTAIKLGIDTGDNTKLLAKQEEVMFKKYFNFIQAETEACRNRSVIAVSIFSLIIVIMVAVPLFNNALESINNIFLY